MKTNTLSNLFSPKRVGISILSMLLLVIAAFSFSLVKDSKIASADNPTFYFSETSDCESSATSITKGVGANTVYLCVDGDNEGDGLLGAEVTASYNTSYVDVTSISCNAFDTCIDLSEEGAVKLLAASGLPNEGGDPVDSHEDFAAISINLLQEGETTLSFTTAKIINDSQSVEVRSGLSLTITVGEGTLPPAVNCGNGVVEAPFEECDDGNTIDGDGCSSVCELEVGGPVCGNAIVESGESCDDGTNDGSYNTCNPNCTVAAHCGDGVTNSDISAETCDDGNYADYDGCSSTCIIEEGYEATAVTLSYINFSIIPSTIAVGETAYAVLNAVYSDNSIKNVTSPSTNPGTSYSSSNVSIANETCSVCSTIAGISTGSATITATYTDGGVTVTNTAGLTVSTPVVPPVVVEEPTQPEAPVVVEEPTQPEAPVEIPTEVRPVAPQDAVVLATIQEAIRVIETERPVVEVGAEIPTDPADDQCVQNFSNEIDTDGDGLTDRTECYLGLLSDKVDTDGDGCWDGAEINQFYTDPTDGEDCNIVEKTEQYVVISDPQPGWVVPSLDISGIAPKASQAVSIVAFSAEYKELKAVIETLENLDSENLSELESAISELETFLNAYTAYEYNSLSDAIVSLRVSMSDENTELSSDLANLQFMLEEPINLGSVQDLPDASVGGETVKGFHHISTAVVTDGKLYDLVAIGTLSDGDTKYSAPVRISIDSTIAVSKPIPRSLGETSITAGDIALNGLFINGVYAENGSTIEIEISDDRPVITGDSEYGAHVFAIWESVVLASSVIADSEEGSFAIQAPKNLETDSRHKVTLYAVQTEGEQKLRSESVNVNFRVLPAGFAWGIVYWVGGITLVLLLMIFLLRRKLKKKPEAETAEAESELAEAEKAYEEVVEPIAGPVFGPVEEPAQVEPVVETSTTTDMPEPVAPVAQVEEMAHDEAEKMEGEIRPLGQVVEPVVEQVVEPTAEASQIDETPDNPVESDGPTPEDHQKKEEEVAAAFAETSETEEK